jgi:hypothetical protein
MKAYSGSAGTVYHCVVILNNCARRLHCVLSLWMMNLYMGYKTLLAGDADTLLKESDCNRLSDWQKSNRDLSRRDVNIKHKSQRIHGHFVTDNYLSFQNIRDFLTDCRRVYCTDMKT